MKTFKHNSETRLAKTIRRRPFPAWSKGNDRRLQIDWPKRWLGPAYLAVVTVSPITEEYVKDWRGVKGLESLLLRGTFALNDCLDQGLVIIEIYRATITTNFSNKFTTLHSFRPWLPPLFLAPMPPKDTETSTRCSLVTKHELSIPGSITSDLGHPPRVLPLPRQSHGWSRVCYFCKFQRRHWREIKGGA